MKKIIIAAVAAVLLCGCGQVDVKKRNNDNSQNDSENNPLFTTTTTSDTLSTNFFPQIDDEDDYIATTQPDIQFIDDENLGTVKTKKTKKSTEPVITIQPVTTTTSQTTTTTTTTTPRPTTTTTTRQTTTTTKASTTTTTTTADTSKQKKYDEAQARIDAAKTASAAAEKTITTIQTKLDEAYAKLAAEQQLLETIKAAFPYSADADGFFNYVQAADAISILKNAEYASSTIMGGSGDASSLENIKRSLEYIRKCNEIREAEGQPELRVSDRMMAYAIADVNVSASYQDHARQFEDIAENLKWGSGDPFESWYDSEKAAEGGHYLNIVDPENGVTGFAINNSSNAILGICCCQVFGGYSTPGDAYSVSAYENRFNDFYKKAKAADVAGHEKNIATLQEAIDLGKSELDKAKATKEAADKEIADATAAYEKLEKEEPKHTGTGHREITL